MRSPVLTSMSYSRGGWVALTELARWMRSSVVLPMALTTATTSLPWRRVRAMWSATARIRSASPTEVPPNFWTTSGIRTRLQTADRPARPRGPASPAPAHPGLPRPGGAIRAAPRDWVGSRAVPSDKRARQRAAREARLAAEAQAAEAPQADPQHSHRRGDRRDHRRDRLPGLGREQQQRGLPVQSGHHDHHVRREGCERRSCRRRPTRWRSRRAARHRPPPRRRQRARSTPRRRP